MQLHNVRHSEIYITIRMTKHNLLTIVYLPAEAYNVRRRKSLKNVSSINNKMHVYTSAFS